MIMNGDQITISLVQTNCVCITSECYVPSDDASTTKLDIKNLTILCSNKEKKKRKRTEQNWNDVIINVKVVVLCYIILFYFYLFYFALACIT